MAPDNDENFEINGLIQQENVETRSTTDFNTNSTDNDQQHVLCHVCGEMHCVPVPDVSAKSNYEGNIYIHVYTWEYDPHMYALGKNLFK